jgi:hypothetical protein
VSLYNTYHANLHAALWQRRQSSQQHAFDVLRILGLPEKPAGRNSRSKHTVDAARLVCVSSMPQLAKH